MPAAIMEEVGHHTDEAGAIQMAEQIVTTITAEPSTEASPAVATHHANVATKPPPPSNR